MSNSTCMTEVSDFEWRIKSEKFIPITNKWDFILKQFNAV